MRSPYEPEPIEVVAHRGTPKAMTLRQRRLQVKEVVNIRRIDEEWRRKPISRLYYDVEFMTGSRFTILQDLVTGQWYRQNWV